MNKIQVIIKRPDERYGHVTNISNTLKNLQKIVDGPIEVVPYGDNIVFICNEEGKLRKLQRNFAVGGKYFHDIIVGTCIIAGVDGEEFCDCPISFDLWKRLLVRCGN